jgi:hypothetical protein
MSASEAGLSHSTTISLVVGSPCTRRTPFISASSDWIADTQCPQDMLGTENVFFCMITAFCFFITRLFEMVQ